MPDKQGMRISSIIICLVLLAASSGYGASGRSRTMYFSQSALNITKVGLAQEQTSSCVIVLSNPSPTSQLVFLRPNATASGLKKGDAQCTLESGSNSPLDSFGATINPGSPPVIVRCTYPSFPKKKSGEQIVICGGEIEARDVTASAGTIEATASLDVFIETQRSYKNLDKDGNVIKEGMGTYPIFSSIPITINGGRPF